jgi:hypothetical protein
VEENQEGKELGEEILEPSFQEERETIEDWIKGYSAWVKRGIPFCKTSNSNKRRSNKT